VLAHITRPRIVPRDLRRGQKEQNQLGTCPLFLKEEGLAMLGEYML